MVICWILNAREKIYSTSLFQQKTMPRSNNRNLFPSVIYCRSARFQLFYRDTHQDAHCSFRAQRGHLSASRDPSSVISDFTAADISPAHSAINLKTTGVFTLFLREVVWAKNYYLPRQFTFLKEISLEVLEVCNFPSP